MEAGILGEGRRRAKKEKCVGLAWRAELLYSMAGMNSPHLLMPLNSSSFACLYCLCLLSLPCMHVSSISPVSLYLTFSCISSASHLCIPPVHPGAGTGSGTFMTLGMGMGRAGVGIWRWEASLRPEDRRHVDPHLLFPSLSFFSLLTSHPHTQHKNTHSPAHSHLRIGNFLCCDLPHLLHLSSLFCLYNMKHACLCSSSLLLSCCFYHCTLFHFFTSFTLCTLFLLSPAHHLHTHTLPSPPSSLLPPQHTPALLPHLLCLL